MNGKLGTISVCTCPNRPSSVSNSSVLEGEVEVDARPLEVDMALGRLGKVFQQ